jgi:DNA-binding PadR family transcriptional regulator
MRTWDLKRNILKMFRGREFYGYEVHKKLVSDGAKIEISRLYRVLGEMLREGLLESRWEKSQLGPKKRVYRLGEKGRKELDRILSDVIETVHEFYSEYLINLPPEVNAFNSICRMLSDNLRGNENIVYVIPKYSAPTERILRGLRSEVPEAKIYLVKPRSVVIDQKLDNIVLLDGTYNGIPLRDSFVDLLVFSGIPQKRFLEASLREGHRVLSQSGTLAILVQAVQVQKYNNPLTIGNFIEKHEYENSEGTEYIDKGLIEATLKKFFKRCEERQVVHMTLFLASKKVLE